MHVSKQSRGRWGRALEGRSLHSERRGASQGQRGRETRFADRRQAGSEEAHLLGDLKEITPALQPPQVPIKEEGPALAG